MAAKKGTKRSSKRTSKRSGRRDTTRALDCVRRLQGMDARTELGNIEVVGLLARAVRILDPMDARTGTREQSRRKRARTSTRRA